MMIYKMQEKIVIWNLEKAESCSRRGRYKCTGSLKDKAYFQAEGISSFLL